jgi:hypothetical protein
MLFVKDLKIFTVRNGKVFYFHKFDPNPRGQFYQPHAYERLTGALRMG